MQAIAIFHGSQAAQICYSLFSLFAMATFFFCSLLNLYIPAESDSPKSSLIFRGHHQIIAFQMELFLQLTVSTIWLNWSFVNEEIINQSSSSCLIWPSPTRCFLPKTVFTSTPQDNNLGIVSKSLNLTIPKTSKILTPLISFSFLLWILIVLVLHGPLGEVPWAWLKISKQYLGVTFNSEFILFIAALVKL